MICPLKPEWANGKQVQHPFERIRVKWWQMPWGLLEENKGGRETQQIFATLVRFAAIGVMHVLSSQVSLVQADDRKQNEAQMHSYVKHTP